AGVGGGDAVDRGGLLGYRDTRVEQPRACLYAVAVEGRDAGRDDAGVAGIPVGGLEIERADRSVRPVRHVLSSRPSDDDLSNALLREAPTRSVAVATGSAPRRTVRWCRCRP